MSSLRSDVYIYDAVRTPKARTGRKGGALGSVAPHDLLGQTLVALQDRGLSPQLVNDVIIGTSTAMGEQGGNIARAALLWAGWPDEIPGGVVNRLCCSGLDAIETATTKVAAGVAELVVAGGVESMSRVPMLADKPAFTIDNDLAERSGYVTMGVAADLTAAEFGYTRSDLDAVALRSHQRALASLPSPSIIPVCLNGTTLLDADDGARADITMESLGELPALFGDDEAWDRAIRRLPDAVRPSEPLHTAGTAPQFADAAAAALLGSADAAKTLARRPVAAIIGTAQAAVRSPLLTASTVASERALQSAGIPPEALDVIEANESFAVSALLMIRHFGLDPDKVNMGGGSIATGHPLGASGGVLLVNALDRLVQTDGEYALVTIPAALGLGAATVIRRLR